MDSVSPMLSFGVGMPKISGLKKNTSFAQGESLVEASVSKHPHVELVHTSGTTGYALNQNFAIVRHADRLDRTGEWEAHPDRETWPNDTPLSRLGHQHATASGQSILKTGKPFGLIISSPYLRCAQTASRIAQVLKCPIKFDLDFGEVFDRSSMVGDAVGAQHRDPEKLESLLLKDFPDVAWVRGDNGKIEIEGTQQTFPESLDAARMRFCFKARQALQLAASKLMSVVIVTHGDALGAVVGMMQKDWKIKHVPYASFAIASRQVMVLEKGSMDIQSDQPVYDHEWDMELSAGFEYEEFHPLQRKRIYALRERELKKMKANTADLDTPYFNDQELASFMDILKGLGASTANGGLLVQQACKAHTFQSHASVVGEPRTIDSMARSSGALAIASSMSDAEAAAAYRKLLTIEDEAFEEEIANLRAVRARPVSRPSQVSLPDPGSPEASTSSLNFKGLKFLRAISSQ